MRRTGVLLALLAAALTVSSAPALSHPARQPDVLVQLSYRAGAAASLRRAGGRLVSRSLRVWKLHAAAASAVLPALRARGAVALTAHDPHLIAFDHLSHGDPLIPKEWWIHAVGDDVVEPPGPGVPATVLDFGLDTTHPEFAGRPNTTALNNQSVSDTQADDHGTAVSSVLAAPANGIGLVGIYPQAALREWDFHDATLSDVLAGFDVASRTKGVINISGGFRVGDLSAGERALLARAVEAAFQRGSLVVAAAGNEGRSGNSPITPAGLPHVLAVAATGTTNRPALFSNRARTIGLAAPGVDIPVAIPMSYPSTEQTPGYDVFDGTSFSSPLVAGAAAWVWTDRPETNTQLFDLMRFSAVDLPPRGRDRFTGYGLLNVPRALARRIPPADPQEPNEDVYEIRPRGLTAAGHTPLTSPSHGSGVIRARLDRYSDPADVYRVWLPAHGRLVVRVQGKHDVDLALWSGRTASLAESGRLRARDRLRVSARPGRRADVVSLPNASRRGAYVYAAVTPGRGTITAVYSLSATARP